MKTIILSVFFFSCANVFAATRTAVVTGNWTSPATWGGTVPQSADIAVIPTGITVTLNVGSGGGLNTPWNNPANIKISGKFVLQGNDPFFSNPCTVEVLSGGEFNDATIVNQYLLTQPSLLKVYSGGKCTTTDLETIIFNGNYVAEYQFLSTVMNGPFTVDVSAGKVTFSAGILPLTLLNFTGRKSGDDYLLEWQTTNEINTESFFIERSSDGIRYESLARVAATASPINNNYSYTDHAVLTGNSFYRLKMTDKDGSFTYSRVITMKKEASPSINVYPSPAKDRINIVTGISGKLSIYNAVGKLVHSQQVVKGNSVLDVSKLTDGVYFIEQAGQRTSFIKAPH